MTYQQVLDIIKAALTERPSGTKVQVENHETAEIAILGYIELVKGQSAGSVVRESHSSVSAGALCNLTWDVPFADTNYSYVVSAFDSSETAYFTRAKSPPSS